MVVIPNNYSSIVVEKYQYAVYGNPLILNQNNKQLTESKYGNPYMFTGQRFDTETRLRTSGFEQKLLTSETK
ncbi:MAG: hypothetical protein FVQ85_19445 [Planctomycetes bacterium]|nr:hypothetical protein [Planctomycetota bacterium]